MHDDTSNPFLIMRRHGFGRYVAEARDVLPDDWWKRYDLSPAQLARGLTYYVAYDDYTQKEIAHRYGWTHPTIVSMPYRVLRKDLGLPDEFEEQ